MKGIVLIKFNEFVVERWGEEFWDGLLTTADLPSQGAFTSTVIYDDQELMTLFRLIIEKNNISIKKIQQAFGNFFFSAIYPNVPASANADKIKDVFEFLYKLQNMIHAEVKKLDPEALLPEFVFIDETPTTLVFQYKSPRQLCYFCEGLVYGLAKHTGQSVNVSQIECEHEGDERCLIKVEKL
ncbi:MAG: putative hydrocarbon binding protein [Psychroserpens sp.]|jgi:predicted hydrocarbon binding protein